MKNVKKLSWGLLALCLAFSMSFIGCKKPTDGDSQTPKDESAGKVDVNWQPKEFIAIGLDETITFNNVEALSDGLMNIRTQPILDFYLEPLAGFDFTASTYAVMNFDRLATATSVNRDTIFSFKEAGIELTAKDISYRLKKLVFDYALSFDFQDWKDGSRQLVN